jgi:redox-sensitive bicupin YhaK (pirin superfamily)
MPTAEQGPFPPFDRFAETLVTSRVERGLHPHLAEEVVTYVLDGQVHHEDGTGAHTILRPGTVLVVTAHEEVRHELNMQPSQEGRSARWLSIVLRLPWHTEAPPTSVQIKEAGDAIESFDGIVQRPVVGSQARADSAIGLECTEIEFTRETDATFPVARDHRGVAYVLQGRGLIEKERVEAGYGALFENIQRLAMHGSPGCRVFLASVPRMDSEESYPEGERFQGAKYPGGRSR